MISIREATQSDIPKLYGLYKSIDKNDDGYFEHAFEQECTVLVAETERHAAGFCLLNWKPRYSLYRRLGIPEIQDINVIPAFRRRGIATALITRCEDVARDKKHDTIGISVGLTKDYGPAQILYAKMGYIPDGNGVTYDREGVRANASYPIDDNMSLMLLKAI